MPITSGNAPPLRIDIMEISSVARRSYDHRLKNSVACSGNSNLFPELAIPKRTTRPSKNSSRLSTSAQPKFRWDFVLKKLGSLHPAKPKVGIRAIRPNQLWHIDVTIVRLVDGTKAYLQAVIDDYSRYVLVWKVSADISAVNTRDLLLSALAKAKIPRCQLLGMR